MKVVIDLLGDPMIDSWNSPTQTISTPGGAFNVLINLKELLKNNNNVEIRSFFHKIPEESFQKGPLVILDEAYACGYPVKFYDCDKNWMIKNTHDGKSFKPDCRSCVFKNLEPAYNKEISILIVSDYNKGFVEQWLPIIQEKFDGKLLYDFCIVDSRYGNTDFNILSKLCDSIIYHISKDSDLQSSTKEWDVIIQTQGINSTLLTLKQLDWVIDHSIPIRNISDTVCTIGCGDTFTASIAAGIAETLSRLSCCIEIPWTPKFEFEHFKEIIRFAHLTCQNVVCRPRTSIVEDISTEQLCIDEIIIPMQRTFKIN